MTNPTSETTRVWLAGDSLTSQKRREKRPETGWGMPFADMFGAEVTIENRAVNGHSTQRFIDEGRWDDLMSELAEGDWVLLQFGHNDESQKRYTYTTPGRFAANLQRFVTEIRGRDAEPVLLTPVTRRRFVDDGTVPLTHPYSPVVCDVAEATATPVLDIDTASRRLLESLGPDRSTLIYLHLRAGEHPNYPAGVSDDTHLNELGARLVAQSVLAALCAAGVWWATAAMSRPES